MKPQCPYCHAAGEQNNKPIDGDHDIYNPDTGEWVAVPCIEANRIQYQDD